MGSSSADAIPITTDFAQCYQLHYGRLIRALCLAGAPANQAEDVAQEAFARALVHWRRVQRGTNPPGYVYRTAFRLYSRRVARHLPSMDADEGACASTGEDLQGEVLTRLSVDAALAAMPPRRRLCATLCFILGFSTGETAEALGIAEGTVRKQLEAARVSLRHVL